MEFDFIKPQNTIETALKKLTEQGRLQKGRHRGHHRRHFRRHGNRGRRADADGVKIQKKKRAGNFVGAFFLCG
jgi:hypothetical protein